MKLIILDRDGVINYDSAHYIKSPEEWLPIPNSLEAIAKLNAKGYTVAIATNQSGIGRGLYTEETLQAIHEKMHAACRAIGAEIDSVFYCPHLPDQQCHCRKPKPGMFEQIAKHYGIELAGIPYIGDRVTDMVVAKRINALPIFVETSYLEQQNDEDDLLSNVFRFADLATAVEAILNGTLEDNLGSNHA